MTLFDAPEPWDIDHETDTDQMTKPKMEDSSTDNPPRHGSNSEEVELTVSHWGSFLDISYWDLRFTIQQWYSSSVVLYETQNPGTFLILSQLSRAYILRRICPKSKNLAECIHHGVNR